MYSKFRNQWLKRKLVREEAQFDPSKPSYRFHPRTPHIERQRPLFVMSSARMLCSGVKHTSDPSFRLPTLQSEEEPNVSLSPVYDTDLAFESGAIPLLNPANHSFRDLPPPLQEKARLGESRTTKHSDVSRSGLFAEVASDTSPMGAPKLELRSPNPQCDIQPRFQ